MLKNTLSIIILLLGLNCGGWAQIALPVYQGGLSKSNLILDYDFSKSTSYPGSGTAVYDLQNSSAATLINGPSFVAGNNFLTFNAASSQYLMTNTNLGTRFSGATGSKHRNTTLLLWVYPTSANGVILSEQGATSLNSTWHDSQIEMVSGTMKFRFWDLAAITSSISTPLNSWYLIALTYDGRYMRAYVNGQLAGTVDNANRLTPYNNNSTYSLHYCIACTDYTNLGSGGGYGSFRLGRFRVYSNALSGADISTIYSVESYKYPNSVFALDAGNSASYPGSGTVWYDYSGNGNNVTLNNITYSSTVGAGSMGFTNGSNSFVNFYAPVGSASTISVEMWVRTSSLNDGMFFGFNIYDIWTSGGNIGFNTGASDVYGLSAAQVSSLGILNNWKHLVFVMNSGSYLNNKIYVNGVSQALSQRLYSQNTANANFNSGYGAINGWRNSTGFRTITMNMATFKIYNRELSATEVSGIFDGEKSRYGL